MRPVNLSLCKVTWDEHGVPHIHAEEDVGWYEGMGYVHARDRGMQMLLSRIVSQGRLAELLAGTDENVVIDTAFRKLGFHVDATEEASKMDAVTATNMAAYCRGVDVAFARRVPWEMRLAGVKKVEPWRPEDSIVWGRVMGHFGLAQTQEAMERFSTELLHAGVSPALMKAWLGPRLHGLDDELVALIRKIRIDDPIVPPEARAKVPVFAASNNWVIAGSKTASGKPMLANDPHLEVNRLPCVWQEVVLEGHGCAMGATVPGIPALVIGRTDKLAWGVTYAYQDATDSWIEEVKDGKYRRDGSNGTEWHEFTVRTETIRRKKGQDVNVIIHENPHGLLQGDPSEDGYLLTTKWAPANGTGAKSMASFMQVLHAPDVESGMALLADVETAWNWVLADDQDIGYQMSGTVPRRSDHMTGFVPLPGWDPANDWDGFIDPKELPHCFNPEEGYFATANDTLVHHGVAPVQNLTMGPYRADRIRDALEAHDGWTLEDVQELQTDGVSAQALRFIESFQTASVGADFQPLADWTGHYDQPAAALFEAWYRALIIDVFGHAFGDVVATAMVDDSGIVAGFHHIIDDLLLDPDSPWYLASRDATWQRVLEQVLVEGVPDLPTFTMSHLMLGSKFGLGRGPFRLPGGRASILQFQAYKVAGRDTTFAPSYRFIADMAKPGAWTVLAGGPTDRPWTRGYASEVEMWLEGRVKGIGTYR